SRRQRRYPGNRVAPARPPRDAGRRTHPHCDYARQRRWRKNRLACGDARHAMGLDKAMIVAGVGCRRGAPAPDIEAAVRAALARANITAGALDVIATIA